MAQIIDGKAIAAEIRGKIKIEIDEILAGGGKAPGLAVILCNNRTDSVTYVRMKTKACAEVGITGRKILFDKEVTEEELLSEIDKLNRDPTIHGILVQLPLPGGIDKERIVAAVAPEKDVDGFGVRNMGELAMWNHRAGFVPCTARGVLKLINSTGIKIEGKDAVVVGCSNTVGLPIALQLMKHHATVTICHARTRLLAEKVAGADIVVVATGNIGLIKGKWIKEGAVVIDVGINQMADKSKKSGFRLMGDVCFDEACERAGFITPVPGGCGPMTVSCLLLNTMDAYHRF